MAKVRIEGRARKMRDQLNDPTPILKKIGALLVADSQQSFKAQRLGKIGWRPRTVPNVAGVLQDFATGRKTPKARRFDERPALSDTGALARSISFEVQGTKSVVVGSRLSYAKVHQEGGVSRTARITKEVQNRLSDWLASASGKRWKGTLGWLANEKQRGKTLSIRIPRRPFLGLTIQTRRYIKKAIGVAVAQR